MKLFPPLDADLDCLILNNARIHVAMVELMQLIGSFYLISVNQEEKLPAFQMQSSFYI